MIWQLYIQSGMHVRKVGHDDGDVIFLAVVRCVSSGGTVVVQLARAPEPFDVHFRFGGIQHVERHVCWKQKRPPSVRQASRHNNWACAYMASDNLPWWQIMAILCGCDIKPKEMARCLIPLQYHHDFNLNASVFLDEYTILLNGIGAAFFSAIARKNKCLFLYMSVPFTFCGESLNMQHLRNLRSRKYCGPTRLACGHTRPSRGVAFDPGKCQEIHYYNL